MSGLIHDRIVVARYVAACESRGSPYPPQILVAYATGSRGSNRRTLYGYFVCVSSVFVYVYMYTLRVAFIYNTHVYRAVTRSESRATSESR